MCVCEKSYFTELFVRPMKDTIIAVSLVYNELLCSHLCSHNTAVPHIHIHTNTLLEVLQHSCVANPVTLVYFRGGDTHLHTNTHNVEIAQG